MYCPFSPYPQFLLVSKRQKRKKKKKRKKTKIKNKAQKDRFEFQCTPSFFASVWVRLAGKRCFSWENGAWWTQRTEHKRSFGKGFRIWTQSLRDWARKSFSRSYIYRPFLLFKSRPFKGSIFFFNWAFGVHREYEKVEFFKGGEKSSQHSSFCL